MIEMRERNDHRPFFLFSNKFIYFIFLCDFEIIEDIQHSELTGKANKLCSWVAKLQMLYSVDAWSLS